MIFVSVGTQLGFDRLIKSLDIWMCDNPSVNVFFQIGQGSYIPSNGSYKRSLSSNEYKAILNDCELLVSHAGMGSILSALEIGKNLVILPRKSSLGEHRNEHQLATATKMIEQKICNVCWSESELICYLENIRQQPKNVNIRKDSKNKDRLLNFLDDYIVNL